VLQSGIELLYRAIKSNIADSLHVVIQIKRRPARRFVSEVLESTATTPTRPLRLLCDLPDTGAIPMTADESRNMKDISASEYIRTNFHPSDRIARPGPQRRYGRNDPAYRDC